MSMLTSCQQRWFLGAAAALLLHVSPLLWLWWPDSEAETSDSPAAAMLIELAPVLVAPDVPETELAPGPEQPDLSDPQQAIEPELEELPEQEEPEAEEAPEPEVVLEQKPETPPEPEQPPEKQQEITEAAPQITPTAQVPVKHEADISAAPVEAVVVNPDAQVRVVSWQERLLGQLNKAKRYPSSARSRKQEGISYLRFSMNRQGQVLAASLERSSGYSELDNETLAMIRRAEPLIAPPADVTGEVIELVVPVEFFLSSLR